MREFLGPGVQMVLSQSPVDPCLQVIPMEQWQERVNKLRQLRNADRDERQFLRDLSSRTELCSLDRQGRVLIPAAMRQHANIQVETEAVVLGCIDIIEIWDMETIAAEEARKIDPDRMSEIQTHIDL